MDTEMLAQLGNSFDEVFFLIGLAMFTIEIIKGMFSRSFQGRELLDVFASASTQLPYLLVEVVLFSAIYAGYSVIAESFVTWSIPTTTLTMLLIVVIADFVYYWEHRVAHELRLFWTQHAVHHSSRFMNISVAARFGPFEGLLSALFHFPLVFLGFSPALVFFGILFVQAYQTWIHTELIGKLGILDRVLNTPSNHRVHHGCDEKYIDKNYGGVLIIWDRIFGTYRKEDETPRYGLARDFDSVNPLTVWVSELPRLFNELRAAASASELWTLLFSQPGTAASLSVNRPPR